MASPFPVRTGPAQQPPSPETASPSGASAAIATATTKSVVGPTRAVPWSVDVVAAVPEAVMMTDAKNAGAGAGASAGRHPRQVLAVASRRRWHARASLVPSGGAPSASSPASSAASSPQVALHVWHDDAPDVGLSSQRRSGPFAELLLLSAAKSNGASSSQHRQHPNYHHHHLSKFQVLPASIEDCEDAVLLGLEVPESEGGEFAYVYAGNAATGLVVVWRVSRGDLAAPAAAAGDGGGGGGGVGVGASSAMMMMMSPQPPYGRATRTRHRAPSCPSARSEIPLDGDAGEVLTSLDVVPVVEEGGHYSTPCVVVGTSSGRIYALNQSRVPLGLTARELPPLPDSGASLSAASARRASTGGGFLSGWLGGGARQPGDGLGGDGEYGDSLFRACRYGHQPSSSSSLFCAVTRQGRIVRYAGGGGGGSSTDLDLLPALQNHFVSDATTSGSGGGGGSGVSLQLKDLRVVSAGRAVVDTSSGGQGDGGILHVVALTKHETNAVLDESRLYWLRLRVPSPDAGSNATAARILSATWLNRFASPLDVEVSSEIVATGDGHHSSYAAFTCRNRTLPVVFMCLAEEPRQGGGSQCLLHELDVPIEAVGDRVWSLESDIVTHGCLALTASGCGLRVRRIAGGGGGGGGQQQVAAAGAADPATLATLTSHIRSSFGGAFCYSSKSQRYLSASDANLPPSLRGASSRDTEVAVLTYAREMLEDEHHQLQLVRYSAYVNWLQKVGLYRSLSMYARWKLLGLGQQIEACQALRDQLASTASSSPMKSPGQAQPAAGSSWERELLSSLKPHQLSEWLRHVQQQATSGGSGQDRQMMWIEWLCLALGEATNHRDERLSLCYDIGEDAALPRVASPDEVPTWTSQPVLQQVLADQIAYWLRGGGGGPLPEDAVESVVTVALQSFADSHQCCPDDGGVRLAYARLQQDAIALLRRVKGKQDDELAFELCRDHGYYAGLCEIAFDHERLSDCSRYQLEPLLRDSRLPDVATGYGLPDFVLKFFCDQGLMGHVLRYGREDCCLEAFGRILEREPVKLQPYRWIYHNRREQYDAAASALVSTAQDPQSNVEQAKRCLGVASIANAVVLAEKENAMPDQQQVVIDKLRERINAQEHLSIASPSSRLYGPEQLLNAALRQCDEATDKEAEVESCFLGLAVCTTLLPADGDAQLAAASVWEKAITRDLDTTWRDFVSDGASAVSEKAIREGTVLGALSAQVEDAIEADKTNYAAWQEIHYKNSLVEEHVYRGLVSHCGNDRASRDFVEELRRLLRSGVF